QPEDAIEATAWLTQQMPERTRELGDALIYALAEGRRFQKAAEFAATHAGDYRTEWLTAAYGGWATYEPEGAAESAAKLQDPAARVDALNSVLAAWTQIDPQGLAEFALSELPEDNLRSHALADALVRWASENPAAVANWINTMGFSPEF